MSETFNGFYTVTALGGGTFQINSVYDASPTLFEDTADGVNDGSIAPGAQLTATSGGSFTETLQGIVPGEGIVTFGTLSFFYSTNDSSLSVGDTVTIDTSTPYTFCFLAGTSITTPAGEVPVEALRIGDPVVTASGKTVPVKWIGHQTIRKTMFTRPECAPVRISSGALGNGLPRNDLFLTSDHGLIIDGLVINAGALVNGDTIRFTALSEMPGTFTYYHVETEAHDVVLANGVPAETFIDYAARGKFDNAAEYMALYGEERTVPELDMPRISAARLVPPSIRARLAGRMDAA
ncbi:MAG: Hint domain-containing protein [Mameliella sp.]|nr:Hint domain-containing protein [Mameliella sp.]